MYEQILYFYNLTYYIYKKDTLFEVVKQYK